MDSGMNGRKATQADEGWRANSTITERKATQVDEGWRNYASFNSRSATEVDEGWRDKSASNGRKVTETDEGWRSQANGRKATEVDEGWRTGNSSVKRKATVVDEGWRNAAAEMLDPANIMNKATANHFATLAEFQEAVAKLSELISSTGNHYPVKKTISTAGGESIILLCSDPDGNDVVAKVYYESVNSAGSSISARTRVLEYMGTDDGQRYTLAVSEIGLVEFGNSKYYFEITPFIPGGDISDDGAFSFDEICVLTKQLNEALHSIHEFGILHRDIKPHNIYKMKNGVVLGDFGVAKIAENGKANVTRHMVGTDGYTAPELRLGLTDSPAFIYDNKSDYYSLGVTLGSLFEGHFVYDNMDEAMMLVSVRNGKLPLTRMDPKREQLENLLNGLCKFDPKYRFGYEDVNRWLIDNNYTGGIVEEEWPKAFRFLGEAYWDEKSLFYGITKDAEHWNLGKELLFEKYFENFFKSFRTDIARAAQVADDLYRGDDRDKGLAVFLKSLFAPGPIVWKGYSFGGLNELGNKMAVAKTPAAYGEILQKHCISHWLAHTEGIDADEDTKKLVDRIESISISEPELACYWFGNTFATKKHLWICGKTVCSVPQLIEAMFDSPNTFYQGDGFRKLISRQDGADFYGFLYSCGYEEIIDKEWAYLKECDMFNKSVLLFSMMDNIAVKAGTDLMIIRNFFVQYGPIGIAVYTKHLLDREGDKVYTPLDSDGKQLISRITSFYEPAPGTVDELFRAYAPLVENVDKFRRVLIDNPFCIVTGVYESKGVMCTNLKGCFAFNIFERTAPLGFGALLETAKGG